MDKITDADRQKNLRESLLALLAGTDTQKIAGSG